MKIGEPFALVSTIPTGAEAPQVVVSLPTLNPKLLSVSFTTYSPHEGLDQRQRKQPERSVVDTVKEFVRNDNHLNEMWSVLAHELSGQLLSEKIRGLDGTQALALNSKCVMQDGSFAHLPMMDFKPTPGRQNLKLITEFIRETGLKGVILESGASYHFLGFVALNPDEWVRFLGKSLLAPYADARWIGHSLMTGTSALRITSHPSKPTVPFVKDRILRVRKRAF